MGKKPFRSSAYYEQAKAIKGFVGFKVPTSKRPSGYTVRKVREYHQLLYGKPIVLDDGEKDWITGLAQGGKYPLRLKGKKLKAAQRYAGHGSVKGLRVAFVPWNGKDTPKLDFDGDTVLDKSGGQNRSIHLFGDGQEGDDNPDDRFVEDMLAGNYMKHVNKAIKEAKGAKAFGVMCGINETTELFNRDAVKKRIMEMVETYADETSNHWAGNWLRGLIAYRTKTFKGALTFRQRRGEFVEKQRKERANAKARKKYARDKGSRGNRR